MNEFIIIGIVFTLGTISWLCYGYFEYIKKKRTHWDSYNLLWLNVIIWGMISFLFITIGIAKNSIL